MSVGEPMSESGAEAIARVMSALYPTVSPVGRLDSEMPVSPTTAEGVKVVASFEPQPEHRGNSGWLQGGLAATVLDHVCARAASAALGQRVVTGTLDLRYPRPVPLAEGPYRVEAEAAEPRRRMVRVRGAILDPQGRSMVEAKALFLVRPAEFV